MAQPLHSSSTPRTSAQADRGDPAATRERLIEAAGQVFAEQGYRNATIREICRRADANIAAVNYHFGDKEQLYLDVVEYAQCCARERYPFSTRADSSPEERLRDFIHAFMLRVLDEGRPAWHGRLMAREMVEPTGVLDHLVATTIRPQFTSLAAIVGAVLRLSPDHQLVTECAASVVGQCMLHRHCRPVLDRLFPGAAYGRDDIARRAEHVFRFSVAAMRSLAPDADNGGPP